MAGMEKTAEPSMEDILASIRKIIAEEPIGSRPAQPAVPTPPSPASTLPVTPSSMARPTPQPAPPQPQPASAPPKPAADMASIDDILSLADDLPATRPQSTLPLTSTAKPATPATTASPPPAAAPASPMPAAGSTAGPSTPSAPAPVLPHKTSAPAPEARRDAPQPFFPSLGPLLSTPAAKPEPSPPSPSQKMPVQASKTPADLGAVVPGRPDDPKSLVDALSPISTASSDTRTGGPKPAEPVGPRLDGSAAPPSPTSPMTAPVSTTGPAAAKPLLGSEPKPGPASEPVKPVLPHATAPVTSPAKPMTSPAPQAAAPAPTTPAPVAPWPVDTAPPTPKPHAIKKSDAILAGLTTASSLSATNSSTAAPSPAAAAPSPSAIKSSPPASTPTPTPTPTPAPATAATPPSASPVILSGTLAPPTPVGPQRPTVPAVSATQPQATKTTPATASAPAPAPATTGSLMPMNSIEERIVELLRPMIREWLDNNMPRMVERALSIELAASAKPKKS